MRRASHSTSYHIQPCVTVEEYFSLRKHVLVVQMHLLLLWRKRDCGSVREVFIWLSWKGKAEG